MSCLNTIIIYIIIITATRGVYLYRERKWVDLGLSNSLKVYKWVPGAFLSYCGVCMLCVVYCNSTVREEAKDDEDENNKENEV